MPPPQNQYTEEEKAMFKREMDEAALLPLPDEDSESQDTEEIDEQDEYVAELPRNEITGHSVWDHGGPGPVDPWSRGVGDNIVEKEEEDEEERPLMERYMREVAAVRGFQVLDEEGEHASSPRITPVDKQEEQEEEENKTEEYDAEEDEEEDLNAVKAYYRTPSGHLQRATQAPGYVVRPAGTSIEDYKDEMLVTGCGWAADSDDDLGL
jgi:hypothetical protein